MRQRVGDQKSLFLLRIISDWPLLSIIHAAEWQKAATLTHRWGEATHSESEKELRGIFDIHDSAKNINSRQAGSVRDQVGSTEKSWSSILSCLANGTRLEMKPLIVGVWPYRQTSGEPEPPPVIQAPLKDVWTLRSYTWKPTYFLSIFYSLPRSRSSIPLSGSTASSSPAVVLLRPPPPPHPLLFLCFPTTPMSSLTLESGRQT